MAHGPASVHMETTGMRLHVMGHLAHDFEAGLADDRLHYPEFEGVGRVAMLGGLVVDQADMDTPENILPTANVFRQGEDPTYTICIFGAPDENGQRPVHTSVLNRAVGQNVLSDHVWPIELHNYASLTGLLRLTEYSKSQALTTLGTTGPGIGKLLHLAKEASADFTVESVKRAARREKWAQRLGNLGLASDNSLVQTVSDAKRLYGTA